MDTRLHRLVIVLSACSVSSAYRCHIGKRSPPLPHLRATICLAADPDGRSKQETREKPAFTLPFLQPDVPADQQPVVELRTLRRQPFYDWVDDDERYKARLFNLYANLMIFLSLPISYTTFNVLPFELPQLFLAANLGTLCAMVPFVVRLRVGYGFVSKRLKEKSSYYEANQRGLFARKAPEAVLRDRLLEQQQVAPAVKRIELSLAALFLAILLSLGVGEVVTILEGEAGPTTLKTLMGDQATQFNNRLRGDDEFAAREQKRAQRKAETGSLKPTYCDSRYFKILAGGNGQGGVGCQ